MNYKFRDLKIYSSTEWLADNKKKYRQVFERFRVTYIYAELSFYNKDFDTQDWEANVELKCFSLRKGRKELCNLPFKRKVSRYDNTVYIREGWGNQAEGAFWKKGTYYWEAWINEQKVATKYFYIEDAGQHFSLEDNPYIEIQSLRLYEGSYDDTPEHERTYYNMFSAEETRYIYLEAILKNKTPDKSWQCELFAKFYNNARELKGQVVRLQRIEKDEDTIKITAGWGSNVKGSWRMDKYTAELVFMDTVHAVIPFEVDEIFNEGMPGVILPNRFAPVMLEDIADIPNDKETFEEVMNRLDNLIGLKAVKQKVRDHAKYLQFLQLRKDKGFKENEEINVHSVFIGNPGTGKTTVAKMMGKLYQKMGLLSKGHVHEVDRVDLIGEYIGQTAPKVKEAIEKARGGVLFIDEAYSLARSNDDSKDFGREAIEILIKEMSNGVGDMAVIVAGYPKEMKHFLESNPGIRSRFKHYFEFSDYLPQELSQIVDYASLQKGVRLTNESKVRIDELIVNAFRNRNRTFGNARFVFDLLEEAKVNLGLRVMANEEPTKLSDDEISIIELEDAEQIKIIKSKELPAIPVDQALLKEAMLELDHMIGMDKIKEEIRELVKIVRFYRESSKNVLNKFFFHTVFVGNPGTGKTTVARILAKIYKALGVLERGHMIETDRQGLVAGFVGQTAIKTAAKIDEAMGGVLFIDEAYSLTSKNGGATGDFGNEAIQTLLKRMEDKRGEFFVFVAGYPDDMEGFLKANPGLNSRFDKVLRFEDYATNELYSIALQMLVEEKLEPSEEAKAHLEKYLSFLYEFRDKYFGNARTVRNVILEAVRRQNLRLANLPIAERTAEVVNQLLLEDVANFKTDKNDLVFNPKKTIGFRAKPDTMGS